MRTPFGFDCLFFFGDYYRGRHHEECRLLPIGTSNDLWSSNLCKTCPVPSITRANACPTMNLTAHIKKGLFGIGKHVEVSAFCTRSQTIVKTPHVGCGSCHPINDVYTQK